MLPEEYQTIQENLERIEKKLTAHMFHFFSLVVAKRHPPIYHGPELTDVVRRWYESKGLPLVPDSVQRCQRYLRQKKRIDYECTDHDRTEYTLLAVAGVIVYQLPQGYVRRGERKVASSPSQLALGLQEIELE